MMLEKKVLIVTGETRGIGLEIVKAFKENQDYRQEKKGWEENE